MFVFRFALKNVLSRKSSFVIILFIAFAISLLFLANAIFDSTDTGIQNTFIKSFTSDIVIKPKTNFPLSLFGDETPVTGELTEIPELIPYNKIVEELNKNSFIKDFTPQISGMTALNINNRHFMTATFGVNANEYFNIMPGLKILKGNPFGENEKGIMLNSVMLEKINKEANANLEIGDNIQLISTDGASFTIRSVPLCAIYEYTIPNQTFERIALLDAATLRSLLKKTDVYADDSFFNKEQINLFDDFNDDELFGNAEDSVGTESEESILDSFSKDEVETQFEEEIELKSTAWSFILCSLQNPAKKSQVITNLNSFFKKNEINAQASNWRSAAGSSVSMIYYLRIIFNIGIILVLLTGFIVVNNTLVISALDRVSETGTLRAIGAGRTFVTLQFFFETSILTITAGILGCFLGFIFCKIINFSNIQIHNIYLVQLFGNQNITTIISFANAIRCFALSILLGIIGSLYPAHIALETNPVVAMRRQS